MKLIISTIGIVIIFIVLMFSYYGLFAKVKIVEKEVGPFWLVYAKHVGDYKGDNPTAFNIYSNLVNQDSLKITRGVSLYYDNPKKVTKENLRSIVGCIVDKKDEDKIEALKKKYKIKKYPVSKSLVAEFPFKGKFSRVTGMFRVYPKLAKYIEKKNYPQVPIMEIFDPLNKKISFIASVDIDSKFFEEFLK